MNVCVLGLLTEIIIYTCISFIHNVMTAFSEQSNDMRVNFSPSNVRGVQDIEIFETVKEDTTIKRITIFSIHRLEMMIASIVGLFIGGQIGENNL